MPADKRFSPEYREAEDDSALFAQSEIVTGPAGQIRGPRTLPLRIRD